MITTTVQASSYNCSFDGGNLSIDSDNKKFTVNNNVYDIDGMSRGKDDFLGAYTKPILLNNKNIRYMWAINKKSQTYFVIVSAENFHTIENHQARCDPQANHEKDFDNLPPKIFNILKTALHADGYITKEMHDEFWSELKTYGNQKQIDKIISSLKLNFIYMQEYQRALWESAKISFHARQVVKTTKLLQLKSELQIKFEEILPFPKNSPDYATAVHAYEKGRRIAEYDAELLLEGAAGHKEITFLNNQTTTIDLNLINAVLLNLDSSTKRAMLLLEEKWIPPMV
jgi:hypothetical protein